MLFLQVLRLIECNICLVAMLAYDFIQINVMIETSLKCNNILKISTDLITLKIKLYLHFHY